MVAGGVLALIWMLKKVVRYTTRAAIAIGSIFLLAWLLMCGYILLNQSSLLKKAKTAIDKQIAGTAMIEKMEVSFFHDFPSVALHLSKVELRDSLWQQHHHDLLEADNIFIALSLRSLFSGKPRAGKVYLENGVVYLFTDSSGYSNKSLFVSGNGKGKEKDVQPPDISLAGMRVVMDDQQRKKLFDLGVSRLDCAIKSNDRKLSLRTSIVSRISSFSFNTEKGSFLRDKTLGGSFTLQFNTASGILQGHDMSLDLDGHPFLFSGRFFPDVHPDPFILSIQVADIPYKKATALLTPKLQEKLDHYDVDKNISLNVSLDAGSADDHTPRILVRMDLDKGTVTTPAGRFADASFSASFTNEWAHGHKREDENSGIRFLAFRGSWENIPVTADTADITNLKHPVLESDLHSIFRLETLNELAESKTIKLLKGACKMNVLYKGPLSENDSIPASISGSLTIDTAEAEYLPHRLRLKDCRASLRFSGQDVVIDRLEAHAGNSMIVVKGIARKLVSLIDMNPEDPALDLTVTSPRLDLHDLASLLGSATETTAASQKSGQAPFGAAAARVDRFLREGLAHVLLEASNISYSKFSGAQARADLLFTKDQVKLNSMQVKQEEGSITLSGVLRRSGGSAGNPVTLQSHIGQVNLSQLFAAFNNFGQQAILEKNLKGNLTADINMTGLLNNKAAMVENSLKGTVDFSIKGGQLMDFGPMEKIRESVLKKRDLSEIRFSELKSRLDVDSTTITVHRMEIQSTALTLFAEGIYDLKKGADMSLQVPLSNLKDRNPDVPPPDKGNNGSAGISVRLRARTGDDGKLKVSWDPFRKAPRASKHNNS